MRPLFFYTLFAFLLSAWLLKFSNFIGYDGVYYARVGENIFAGKGISANGGEPYLRKPSFYPFLLGLANLFFKDPELSGHLVSILAFALSAVPLFFLARSIYSEPTAHWASLLYVTNGYLHLNANLVMTESVFTFFLIVLLFLLHRLIQAERPGLLGGALVGGAAGILSLTRLDGLLFYGAGLLAIIFFSASPFRRRVRTLFISLAFFLPLFLPYLLFLHHHTHQFQLGNALTEILIRRELDVAHPNHYLEVKKMVLGLTPDKTGLRLGELVEKFNLFDCLTRDHFALVRSIFPSMIWRLVGLSKYFFGGIGFFFIGASWFSTPWDEKRKRAEFLFLLFLSTFVFQLFGEFIPKRYFFYFPLLLIGMGNGVERFRIWAGESFQLSPARASALALGVCLGFASVSAGYITRTLRRTPPPFEYKEMGLWMKENIPHISEERVAATHPSVNFYSGARLLNPPYLPYVERFGDFLTYLLHQKTKYFVVSGDSGMSLLTDSYRSLLDETKAPPPGISRIHTVTRNGRKIILYQFIP